MTNQVMTEKQASKYIGMSSSYLQHARCYGVTGDKTPGPTYLRFGRSIRYLRADLDDWLLGKRVK